jgi:hypothetical protein
MTFIQYWTCWGFSLWLSVLNDLLLEQNIGSTVGPIGKKIRDNNIILYFSLSRGLSFHNAIHQYHLGINTPDLWNNILNWSDIMPDICTLSSLPSTRRSWRTYVGSCKV